MVVSDMDGTLLTPDKRLTPAVLAMARELAARGVPLCLASARAPAQMAPYIARLGLGGPSAAFNGGIVFLPDGKMSVSRVLPPDVLSAVHDMLHTHRIETWLFRESFWIVRDEASAFVEQERRLTGIAPHVAPDLRGQVEGIGKIVGVSADYPLLERMEIELGAMLKDEASVRRSSDYLLDITPVLANKGEALRELARAHGVDPAEVACIGDADNDLPMFARAGLSIAMGQAEENIRAAAYLLTGTNEENGWVTAMERYVLPRIPAAAGELSGAKERG